MQSHLPHASSLSTAEQVALVANLKELFDQVWDAVSLSIIQ